MLGAHLQTRIDGDPISTSSKRPANPLNPFAKSVFARYVRNFAHSSVCGVRCAIAPVTVALPDCVPNLTVRILPALPRSSFFFNLIRFVDGTASGAAPRPPLLCLHSAFFGLGEAAPSQLFLLCGPRHPSLC